MLKVYFENKRLFFPAVFLLLLLSLAMISVWVTPYPFYEQHLESQLLKPNFKHWMGTDVLGRDLFSRVLVGSQATMAVAILTALVSAIIGTAVGAVSGYFGGVVDRIFMRVVDLFYALPSLVIAILVGVVLGHGLHSILVAISLLGWVQQARLVRGQVLQIREYAHVEAAKAVGAGSFLILRRHIVPLVWGPALVSLTYQIPSNILTESFLSFIGLGLQPPLSSWGTLANEGFRGMTSYPHLIIFPGLALFLTMMAFQLLGDGLQERLSSIKN